MAKHCDGPVLPVVAPVVDFHFLPGITCKTISEVRSDYKRYFNVVADDAGFLFGAPVEEAENIDDVFAQKAL